VASQNGSCSGRLPARHDKGMSGASTSVYDVSCDWNAGWPTGRESYGHGVPIVVDGVTPIQGDGNAVHRAKWDR
jgi:hypothetical protein